MPVEDLTLSAKGRTGAQCPTGGAVHPLLSFDEQRRAAKLHYPKHCPRCGSVNIVPDFVVLAAWDCLGCDRSFCPE